MKNWIYIALVALFAGGTVACSEDVTADPELSALPYELPRGEEGAGYLQHRRDARGVVVRAVVNLVAAEHGVVADVVVVRADDDDFVGVLALDGSQDVGHVELLVRRGAELGHRVGVHLPALAPQLPLGVGGDERMAVRRAQRTDAHRLQCRHDVLRRNAPARPSGFAALQLVAGQKFHVRFGCRPVDGGKSPLLRCTGPGRSPDRQG